MHFFPTKKTEFVSKWLFRVSLLVVRKRIRPTFRDPSWDIHENHRPLHLERSEWRWVKSCWSLYVCDVLFWNTVGCIDSVHPNGYPTSFPGSFPIRGPSRRGHWERDWWLPPNVLTSQCLVTSFISVLRRSAGREIMGLLDIGLVTFILSQCHLERHVKE